MKQIILDASVVVKWLIPDRDGEENVEQALKILQLIQASKLSVQQPPHWLAEVAAVVTRLSPDSARQDIEDLCEMELETLNTTEVYLEACELSSKLCHHLFDTLYHAVALILPDAILITADEKYYRKSNSAGRILMLESIGRSVEWSMLMGTRS
jgi:predicted nucleic acid-binding protein